MSSVENVEVKLKQNRNINKQSWRGKFQETKTSKETTKNYIAQSKCGVGGCIYTIFPPPPTANET